MRTFGTSRSRPAKWNDAAVFCSVGHRRCRLGTGLVVRAAGTAAEAFQRGGREAGPQSGARRASGGDADPGAQSHAGSRAGDPRTARGGHARAGQNSDDPQGTDQAVQSHRPDRARHSRSDRRDSARAERHVDVRGSNPDEHRRRILLEADVRDVRARVREISRPLPDRGGASRRAFPPRGILPPQRHGERREEHLRNTAQPIRERRIRRPRRVSPGRSLLPGAQLQLRAPDVPQSLRAPARSEAGEHGEILHGPHARRARPEARRAHGL